MNAALVTCFMISTIPRVILDHPGQFAAEKTHRQLDHLLGRNGDSQKSAAARLLCLTPSDFNTHRVLDLRHSASLDPGVLRETPRFNPIILKHF